MGEHNCCDAMRKQLAWRCDQHAAAHDCPDALVARFGSTGEFGIYIHDGGSSYVAISHCPWCGTDLARLRSGGSDVAV